MNDNNNKLNTIIITAVITCMITILATAFVYYHYLDNKGVIVTKFDSNSSLEDKLNTIKTALDKLYLHSNDINETELIDSALKGYVSGVGDEYTELLTKKEFSDLEEQLSEYVGIGIYASQTVDGQCVILGPAGKDSPAFEAGIKAYDVVVKVNDEDVTGLDLDQVTAKIKGKEGTKVKVTVKRDKEELDFEIERKTIKVAEITGEIIEGDIGYMDFDSFTEESGKEFKKTFEELKGKGAKKLIIDLRDNTGGYVDSAEQIMDLFLNKGQIEYITVDNENHEETTTAKTEKEIDMPVVILTNEYTASASEIFTGCLKDYKLATVVGTKSFGKGVIQSILPILNGDAYLKVTTMKYVTPNKNEINKVGIKPDVEVELDEKTLDDKLDNQVKEAIKVLNK